MHFFSGFVFFAVLATIQAMPTLSTDAQALIRTTQDTGNETLFSTSPISSSTFSPPMRLNSMTIGIIAAVGGLLFLVLLTIVFHVCTKGEIRRDSLSESGAERRSYVPCADEENRRRLREEERFREQYSVFGV
ncbi:unnamed protein product [Caenorhabditis nigoni]